MLAGSSPSSELSGSNLATFDIYHQNRSAVAAASGGEESLGYDESDSSHLGDFRPGGIYRGFSIGPGALYGSGGGGARGGGGDDFGGSGGGGGGGGRNSGGGGVRRRQRHSVHGVIGGLTAAALGVGVGASAAAAAAAVGGDDNLSVCGEVDACSVRSERPVVRARRASMSNATEMCQSDHYAIVSTFRKDKSTNNSRSSNNNKISSTTKGATKSHGKDQEYFFASTTKAKSGKRRGRRNSMFGSVATLSSGVELYESPVHHDEWQQEATAHRRNGLNARKTRNRRASMSSAVGKTNANYDAHGSTIDDSASSRSSRRTPGRSLSSDNAKYLLGESGGAGASNGATPETEPKANQINNGAPTAATATAARQRRGFGGRRASIASMPRNGRRGSLSAIPDYGFQQQQQKRSNTYDAFNGSSGDFSISSYDAETSESFSAESFGNEPFDLEFYALAHKRRGQPPSAEDMVVQQIVQSLDDPQTGQGLQQQQQQQQQQHYQEPPQLQRSVTASSIDSETDDSVLNSGNRRVIDSMGPLANPLSSPGNKRPSYIPPTFASPNKLLGFDETDTEREEELLSLRSSSKDANSLASSKQQQQKQQQYHQQQKLQQQQQQQQSKLLSSVPPLPPQQPQDLLQPLNGPPPFYQNKILTGNLSNHSNDKEGRIGATSPLKKRGSNQSDFSMESFLGGSSNNNSHSNSNNNSSSRIRALKKRGSNQSDFSMESFLGSSNNNSHSNSNNNSSSRIRALKKRGSNQSDFSMESFLGSSNNNNSNSNSNNNSSSRIRHRTSSCGSKNSSFNRPVNGPPSFYVNSNSSKGTLTLHQEPPPMNGAPAFYVQQNHNNNIADGSTSGDGSDLPANGPPPFYSAQPVVTAKGDWGCGLSEELSELDVRHAHARQASMDGELVDDYLSDEDDEGDYDYEDENREYIRNRNAYRENNSNQVPTEYEELEYEKLEEHDYEEDYDVRDTYNMNYNMEYGPGEPYPIDPGYSQSESAPRRMASMEFINMTTLSKATNSKGLTLPNFIPASGCTNASDFIVRCFVARMRVGIQVTKHSRARWCQSQERVLHILPDGCGLTWLPLEEDEPNNNNNNNNNNHSMDNQHNMNPFTQFRSAFTNMSRNKEKSPPRMDLKQCVEVRHAWSRDPRHPKFTGTPTLRQKCKDGTAKQSFALIFPDRTVDFTAATTDQCKILMEGFSALCFRLQMYQLEKAAEARNSNNKNNNSGEYSSRDLSGGSGSSHLSATASLTVTGTTITAPWGL